MTQVFDLATVIILFMFIICCAINKKNYFLSFAGFFYSIWFTFTQIDHTDLSAYLLTGMMISLVVKFGLMTYLRFTTKESTQK